MVMGDPLDEKTDIGTIISTEQFGKVQRYIEQGQGDRRRRGPRLLRHARRPGAPQGVCSSSRTSSPTCRTTAPWFQEEIFGPVTCIFPFDEPEEVLAQGERNRIRPCSVCLDEQPESRVGPGAPAGGRPGAGSTRNLVVQANLSYGGVKSSGLGKEASLEAMLEHFMHKKTIMVNYA